MILTSFRDTNEGLVVTYPIDSIADRLNERSAQLHSLIETMLADDHVFDMAKEIQHDLLWLAGSLSEEIRQMLGAQVTEDIERHDRLQRENAARSISADIESMTDHDLSVAAQAVIARAHESEHA
jgi:hypothetical protein